MLPFQPTPKSEMRAPPEAEAGSDTDEGEAGISSSETKSGQEQEQEQGEQPQKRAKTAAQEQKPVQTIAPTRLCVFFFHSLLSMLLSGCGFPFTASQYLPSSGHCSYLLVLLLIVFFGGGALVTNGRLSQRKQQIASTCASVMEAPDTRVKKLEPIIEVRLHCSRYSPHYSPLYAHEFLPSLTRTHTRTHAHTKSFLHSLKHTLSHLRLRLLGADSCARATIHTSCMPCESSPLHRSPGCSKTSFPGMKLPKAIPQRVCVCVCVCGGGR